MRGRIQGDPSAPRYSRHDWWGVVIDCPDARALAHFYSALLGWKVDKEDDQDAAILADDGVAYISFQTAREYARPVWPPEPGKQQMMLHLDFEVTDLEEAVEHALELGAEEASFQPLDHARVMLDPAGHPFCLYAEKSAD